MRIEFIPPEASGSVSLVETGNISRYLNNPDMGHGYSYSVDGRGYILSGVPASGYKIDWGYGIRFEKGIVRKKWYSDGRFWTESEFTSTGYLLSEGQNEKSIIDGFSDEEFYLEWPYISYKRSFHGKTTEYYPQDQGGGISLEDTVEIVSAVIRFIKTNDITIDVSASPSDGGSVSGGGTYHKGTVVTVTATAAQPNYEFSRWETPDGTIVSTQASYSFTANENRTLIAKFEEIAWLDVQVLAHDGVSIANLPISIGGTTYYTDENGRFHIDKFVQGRCDIRCPNIVYGDYTDVQLGRIYTDSPRTFIPFSTTFQDATFTYQGYGQYYVSGSTTLYIEYVRLGFCVGTQKLIDLLYAWSKDPPRGGAAYDFVYLEYFDNFYHDRVEWYKAYAAIQDYSPDVVAPLNTKDSSGTIGRLKLHSMQEVLDVYGNIFTANGRYLSGNVNDLTLNYDKDGESTEEERSSIPEVVVEQLKHYGREKCPLVIVDANYLNELFDVHVYATDETFSKTGNVVLKLESSFSVKSSTYPYEDITYSFANDYEVIDKETTISGVAPKKGAFTVMFKNSYTTHPRPVEVKIDGVTAKAIQVGDYNKYIYDVSESSKHRIDIYFSTFNGLLYDPESDGFLFDSKSERLIYITPNSL